MEDLIIMFIKDLFPEFKSLYHMELLGLLEIIDIEFIDEAEDLVTTFENQLRQRRYGRVIY